MQEGMIDFGESRAINPVFITDFGEVRVIGQHLEICMNNTNQVLSEYDALAILSDFEDDSEFDRVLSALDKLVPSENAAYFTLRCCVKMCRVAMASSYRMQQVASPKTYLMKDESTGFIKIGRSVSPSIRERTLQAEKPTISLLKVCDSLVERELHEQYENNRVRGEWFNLSDEEIAKIVEEYKFYDYGK